MKTEKEIRGLIEDADALAQEDTTTRMVEMVKVTMKDGEFPLGGYIEWKDDKHVLMHLQDATETFLEGGSGLSLIFTIVEITEREYYNLSQKPEFEGW